MLPSGLALMCNLSTPQKRKLFRQHWLAFDEYLGRQYFACRRCNRLGYSVENQDFGQRLWIKTEKIARRLGEDLSRPKGMRERTYQRLIEQYWRIYKRRDAWFDRELLRR